MKMPKQRLTDRKGFLASVATGAALLAVQAFGAEVHRGETFSGRVDLPAFTAGADGLWRVKTPAGAKFDQLWVDGRLAVRARQPNKGYLYAADPARPSFQAFVVHDPTSLAPLKDLSASGISNVLARLYYSWDTEPIKLAEVDAKTGYVKLVGKTYYPFISGGSKSCNRFTLENARGFLDAPGEWFHDEKAGELLYLPRPGETVATARAAFAGKERLLRLDGAKDVVFDGCIFEYAGHLFAPKTHPHQSASYVGAAIELNRSSNVVFTNCTFRNVAEWAVWFNEGCRDSRVVDCRFEDLGAGAVRAGPIQWDPKSSNEAIAVSTERCTIRRGGRIFPEACGVLYTYAANCRIAGNEVADFFYTGISLGWTWGYGKTPNRDNLVVDNHVWNIAKRTLGDVGGIYQLGDAPGTVIAGNLIHDVYAYDYNPSGSHGIYLDEGSQRVRVVSNRVLRCRSGDFTLHYGKDNVVADNLFGPPLVGTKRVSVGRPEEHHQVTFTNNIEAAADDPRFADVPPPPVWEVPEEPPKRKIPTSFREDFETYAVGEVPSGMISTVCGVSVTDAVARRGTRSLLFADRKGLAWKYAPHAYLSFAEAEERFVCGFALRLEAEHHAQVQFRNYANAAANGLGFATGPGFAVNDGNLTVTGGAEGPKSICHVPTNTWVSCRFTFTRTNGTSAAFKLEVKPAGGKKTVHEGMCAKGFVMPTWFGFMSNADWTTSFQVDDLAFKCD